MKWRRGGRGRGGAAAGGASGRFDTSTALRLFLDAEWPGVFRGV